jgi:hypothetical protein
MPQVGLHPMAPAFEEEKEDHALDWAAAVTGVQNLY